MATATTECIIATALEIGARARGGSGGYVGSGNANGVKGRAASIAGTTTGIATGVTVAIDC